MAAAPAEPRAVPARFVAVRPQLPPEMPVDFTGYWKMLTNENFEEYLRALGKPPRPPPTPGRPAEPPPGGDLPRAPRSPAPARPRRRRPPGRSGGLRGHSPEGGHTRRRAICRMEVVRSPDGQCRESALDADNFIGES